MTEVMRSSRILIIDDDPSMGNRLRENLLSNMPEGTSVDIFNSFDEGERALRTARYDIAVLDVLDGRSQDGAQAGVEIYDRIREAQWLPVVFCTAQPVIVEGLAAQFVRVVNKRDIVNIPKQVAELLESGVPQFTRRIAEDVDRVVRAFVRDHVATTWNEMSQAERDDILPHLANRLSHYIRTDTLEMTSPGVAGVGPHPTATRFWLRPPVVEHPTTGDLYKESQAWWVLATPECDLEVRSNGEIKADYLRLLRAFPLEEVPGANEIATAEAGSATSNNAKDRLGKILGDHSRYFYLPAFLDIPHLAVDFEQMRSVPKGELGFAMPGRKVQSSADGPRDCAAAPAARAQGPVEGAEPASGTVGDKPKWTRLASIDAPYRQALLYRIARATSRVGVEDFPLGPALDHLEALRRRA